MPKLLCILVFRMKYKIRMNKNLIVVGFLAILFSCQKSTSQMLDVEFQLKSKHKEVSGMAHAHNDDQLWMLQDKGNKPELFCYSSDGSLVHQLLIEGVQNNDWEDLAIDSEGDMYIGDFGNNKNDRKDLAIYKIEAKDLTQKSVEPSALTYFSYPEQTDFPPTKSKLKFDCEAFVVTDNYFYLFTKNRSKGFDGEFYIYRVPNKAGNFEAELIGVESTCSQYRTCSITGASLSPDGKYLVLLTHDYLFIKLFQNGNFINQEWQRIALGHSSQKEAITFGKDFKIWIAEEQSAKNSPVNVYSLPFSRIDSLIRNL